MPLVMSLKRRAMALRPSISGSNAVPFVIRERCLLERRSTGAGSADKLRAAFLACFGGLVATRRIAPDLPGMRADAVMNVSLFSQVQHRSRSLSGGDQPRREDLAVATAGSAVAVETRIATKATADVGCQISDSFFGIGFSLALARPSGVSFEGDCLMTADRQY